MGEVYKTYQDFCLYDIANKCMVQTNYMYFLLVALEKSGPLALTY